MKTLSSSYVKYTSRVPLILLTVAKIKSKKFDFVLLLSSFPSCIIQSIRHIQMIHAPNDCTSIRDLPFHGQSCTRGKIDELWPQTCIVVASLYAILYIITYTMQKLKVVQQRLTFRRIVSLLKIYILLVRVVNYIGWVSYRSKHSLQPLSDTTFCAYLHL